MTVKEVEQWTKSRLDELNTGIPILDISIASYNLALGAKALCSTFKSDPYDKRAKSIMGLVLKALLDIAALSGHGLEEIVETMQSEWDKAVVDTKVKNARRKN